MSTILAIWLYDYLELNNSHHDLSVGTRCLFVVSLFALLGLLFPLHRHIPVIDSCCSYLESLFTYQLYPYPCMTLEDSP